MTSLAEVLQKAQSPDPHHRNEGERLLKQFEQTNLPQFLLHLSIELAGQDRPAHLRRLAGLILKNSLTAQDADLDAQRIQRWLMIDPNLRNQIKLNSLNTLKDAQKHARSAAAVVVSAIGIIELPRKQWPELIPVLVQNMTTTDSNVKEATLETLGYICDGIDETTIRDYSNNILTAVVQGLRKEEPSQAVQFAGATALLNALEFAKPNMDKKQERDYIMQVICEATQSKVLPVRVTALQCLVKVGSLYYDKINTWMQNIFNITIEAMKKDEDPAAQQAIEFWATVCDVEIEIIIELEESQQMRIQPTRKCFHYIKGALKFLIPEMCNALMRQEEDQDEDAWNVATAAGGCMASIALTVLDDVVAPVMPFIQQNIHSQQWRNREAAILAFGSILEGPTNPSIKNLVKEALSILLPKLKDPVELVQDTAAWTIGRICQFHSEMVIPQLNIVMGCLLEALSFVPRVAAKVCWAINNMAMACEDRTDSGKTPLSPYFRKLLEVLLRTTERSDAESNFLRPSAYETMNSLIQNSGKDCAETVKMLIPVFLQRLQATFAMQTMSREAIGDLQGYICGALRSCTISLDAGMTRFADQMMEAYLKVLQANAAAASVAEEVLMAVGAVANAVSAQFIRYMAAFRPWIEAALKNWEEHSVCGVAVGLVGDVCRAIGEGVLQFIGPIIELLLANLRNSAINRDVKPPILSCFGDIALALSGKFEPWLPNVMGMLLQASQVIVKDVSDYDFVDYVNLLREDILEAYTAIIQGLRSDDKAQLILPYTRGILQFVGLVWGDPTKTEAVTRGAVGVLGDLAHSCGSQMKPLLHTPAVGQLITEALQSPVQQTQEVAHWAKRMIEELK